MNAYLVDTNGLIYYYEGDPLGRKLEELLHVATNRFYVTTLTLVEFRSALATRVRDGELTAADYNLVVKQFVYDMSSLVGRFHIQPMRKSFFEPCILLIEEYALRQGLGLRTLDCLHLRVALDLLQREPELRVVTADRAFANVAKLAGVPPLLLEPPVEVG